ncbi:peptidyl-prolyl cis-trans isomerase B (cyclophilin B) [Amycolatopsis arida]|uniref:Peptidyl-prolyl cis-trans isomerase B (Cyclophilin B) n=1 Tax=Amycolatopsis arida TaxID=587909 RepID=A0A1I5Z572_9PSEU|nr:peptidylprolyl isomerase [Amycolatopsis arida]TDX90150.1 peptidyl-prolyl cis-trans isomerase B (cyclophilin B) [Amycolatopsis arida]SFQ51612.1 peptidyl-prolyl cis-trans isomerase B (cyclophilin B) [Amycolatopsis arida]
MATNQQRREAAKRKLERQLARRAERARRRRIVGVGVTVGAVVVAAGLIIVLATRGGDDAAAQDPTTSETPPIDIPTERAPMPVRPEPLANPVSCEYPTEEPAAKEVRPPQGGEVPSIGTVDVTLHSTAGDIPLTLDRALAPCTVHSFLSLAEQGYYTDSECHRLGTEGLQMLQCGDPKGDGSGGPGYTVPDENFPELTYGRGLLAMAKKQAPNSGGGQFFMVYGEAQLSPDYTVFGNIGDPGLEVLDRVARDGIDPAQMGPDGTGKPKTPLRFTGVTVG